VARVGYFGRMRNHSIASRRPRWTPQERAQLVAAYQASGLTQREFAQQHGVKLGTFQQEFAEFSEIGTIRSRQRLGGLLRYHYRKAA